MDKGEGGENGLGWMDGGRGGKTWFGLVEWMEVGGSGEWIELVGWMETGDGERVKNGFNGLDGDWRERENVLGGWIDGGGRRK